MKRREGFVQFNLNDIIIFYFTDSSEPLAFSVLTVDYVWRIEDKRIQTLPK